MHADAIVARFFGCTAALHKSLPLDATLQLAGGTENVFLLSRANTKQSKKEMKCSME